MEPQFKSSFIPKKPVAPQAARRVNSRPLGILFAGASLVFIVALLAAAGVFGYSRYLEQSIEEKSAELDAARQAFQPRLIEELRRLDARLVNAKTLLTEHVALSPIFEVLERGTLTSVQYLSFSYTAGPEGVLTLSLEGKARDFKTLASQADELNRARNEGKYQAVTFSDLAVDELGNVGFALELEIDPSVVSYVNHLAPLSGGSPLILPVAVPAASSTVMSTTTSTSSPQ